MTDPARNRQDARRPTPVGPPPSFGAGGGGVPPVTVTQADAVAEWLKWHSVELIGIGVPLALGLAVSLWLVLLAVPAAALWATHGVREARRPELPATGRDALTGPETTPGETSEETES